MEKLILGIDAGNHMAKVVGSHGYDKFKTNISEWFQRNLKETFGSDDMEFEVDGQKGFAGTIAMYENEFGDGSIYGETKAHDDTRIRTLLAVTRYLIEHSLNTKKVSIVVGQPIKGHTDEEKDKIKKMLLGDHEVVINGQKRNFIIENVGVAQEGSSAFWGCPHPENTKTRIIDIGSGTINAATIINKLFINTSSDTFNFGMETVSNKNDYKMVSRGIISNITKLKWSKSDKIYVCGGASEEILPFIIELYPNAELLKPQILTTSGARLFTPLYANAVGFYVIGKGAFG